MSCYNSVYFRQGWGGPCSCRGTGVFQKAIFVTNGDEYREHVWHFNAHGSLSIERVKENLSGQLHNIGPFTSFQHIMQLLSNNRLCSVLCFKFLENRNPFLLFSFVQTLLYEGLYKSHASYFLKISNQAPHNVSLTRRSH